MNQAPFVFAGIRIDVAVAKVAVVVGVFEVFNPCGETAILGVEELDGALVLLAASDQELLFVSFALEGDARHLEVEHDRDGGGEDEDEEEGEALFGGAGFSLQRGLQSPQRGVATWEAEAEASVGG